MEKNFEGTNTNSHVTNEDKPQVLSLKKILGDPIGQAKEAFWQAYDYASEWWNASSDGQGDQPNSQVRKKDTDGRDFNDGRQKKSSHFGLWRALVVSGLIMYYIQSATADTYVSEFVVVKGNGCKMRSRLRIYDAPEGYESSFEHQFRKNFPFYMEKFEGDACDKTLEYINVIFTDGGENKETASLLKKHGVIVTTEMETYGKIIAFHPQSRQITGDSPQQNFDRALKDIARQRKRQDRDEL